MNRLWGLLTWFIVAVICVTLALQLIEKYLWLIGALFVVTLGSYVAWKVWKHISGRRTHY